MSTNRSLRISLDRIRARLASLAGGGTLTPASAFEGLDVPAWIVANTRSPGTRELPFSFADHEFQTAIFEARPKTVVRKPAQVGLSEGSVRLALALAVLRPATHTIYTLPTSRFAAKFSASRIDTVVEASPSLRLLRSKDTFSTELKRFGDSFLWLQGTYGQQQAISVPASTLIRDEVDFSDQGVLKSFASRLEHAGDTAVQIDFSTPTVAGFGISALFALSSQGERLVCHQSCNRWTTIDIERDLVVPGYDEAVTSLSADVAEHFECEGAMLLCGHCRKPISQANLADPARRAWVHRHPDRDSRGFAVSPFDVPMMNTPASVVGRVSEYERPSDWVNFALGLPYENADVAFLKSRIEASPRVETAASEGNYPGCVAGLDVGKICWLTVATQRRNSGGQLCLDVVEMRRMTMVDPSKVLGFVDELVAELKRLGVVRLVVDGLPDLLLVELLKSRLPDGMVWSTFYSRARKTGRLYIEDPVEHTLSVDRTSWFDKLAQEVNGMRHGFVRGPEWEVFRAHLESMKRIIRGDTPAWVSTGNGGDDHFAHAFAYVRVAAEQVYGGRSGFGTGAVGPSFSVVPMRRAS